MSIIRDSSIWCDETTLADSLSQRICLGIVVDKQENKILGNSLYKVEIMQNGTRSFASCVPMVKFGSLYNYEEFSYTKMENMGLDVLRDRQIDIKLRSGDSVVVALMSNNEGVILGAIKHPMREQKIKSDKIAYESCYRGLKTQIEEDGAYKVTFQGKPLPSVEAQLKAPSLTPQIPDDKAYNPLISGSYFTFDSSGSYEVTDASKTLPQSIRIDKSGGTITMTSGLVTVTLNKNAQTVDVVCVDASVSAKKSMKIDTTKLDMTGVADVKIKGAKIAIGFGGIELIDSLIQLIDNIGLLIIPHHLGPCSPVSASPTWPQIIALRAKLSLIKGSL